MEIEYSASDYFRRGIGYYFTGKYKEAIKCFDETIKIDPNYINAYFYRGASLRNSNLFNASTLYQRAIADFKNVANNSNNIFAKSAQTYIKQIEGLCKSKINEFNDQITNNDPCNKNGYSYFMLGYWYKIIIDELDNTSGLDKAIQHYDSLIKDNLTTDENNAAAYYCRHNFHFERGKRSGEIEDFKKATDDLIKTVELDANNVMAYFALGHYSRFNLTKQDKTMKYYTQLLNYYKETNDRKKIAAVHFMIGNYRYEQAKSYKRSKPDGMANYFTAAIQHYKKAIDFNAVLSYLMLGNCYGNLNDYDIAVKWYNKLIENSEKKALAYYVRAFCHKRFEKNKERAEDLENAIKFGTENYQKEILEFLEKNI